MPAGRPRCYSSRSARDRAYYRRKKLQITEPDDEFWSIQGEVLGDLLRWLTSSRSLAGMGARCCSLALYLNPSIVNKSALRQIAAMPDAPTRAALSKSMLEFQAKYGLKPSYYQKAEWMRDRYRRSAIVAHEERNQIDEADSDESCIL